MKRPLLKSLLLLSALLPFASAQDATPAAPNIAFVRPTALLEAHPAGQAASELEQQARAELEQITQEAQPLIDKRNAGQQLTPDEQDLLELSQRTLQETQQRYQQEIETAAQPATEAINALIQEVAQEGGYTMVLNYEVAQTSSLVVYADPASHPDITEEVISRIEGATPSAGEGETGN